MHNSFFFCAVEAHKLFNKLTIIKQDQNMILMIIAKETNVDVVVHVNWLTAAFVVFGEEESTVVEGHSLQSCSTFET